MLWLRNSVLLALLMITQVVAVETNFKDDSELPREVTINGVELVLIPAGWFWYSVGVDIANFPVGAPNHRNVHIWLDSFYLAKYEASARELVKFLNSGAINPATLAQYKKNIKQQSKKNQPLCSLRKKGNSSWELRYPKKNLPATDVFWTLATELAVWQGLRLPSEAEWQKGARGSDRRDWPWGNTFPDDTYGHFGWGGEECAPISIDAYPKGRSPYGLYNMAGNVGEHVADWFNQDFYDGLTDGMRNPPLAQEGTSLPYQGTLKISKGGLWTRNSRGSRISERRELSLDRAKSRNGFRFAADITTVQKFLVRQALSVKPKENQ